MADLKISVDMKDIPVAVQATQRFKRQINTLAAQLARGSITTGTYQKGLQQLSRQYSKLGVGINTAKSAVMSYGRAAAEAAREQQALLAATQASTKGFARSGVVMQQTGYQVGDFLVQVQSGTNAFVAFGQQATQLAGLLTMSMNPSLIALGAGLSIAIPLMTAIAAAFMRTSSAGKSFADRLSEASRSVEELKEATDLLRIDSLSQLEETYGRVNDSLREFLALSAEALRLRAIEDVLGSLNSLRYELRGIFSTETTSLQSLFDINLGQANQLVASLTRAVEATDLDTQLQNVIQLRDRILAATDGVENMTSEQRLFYLQVIEAEDALRRALNVTQQVSNAIGEGATNASVLAGNLLQVLTAQNAINAGFAVPGSSRRAGGGRGGPGGPLIGTIETGIAALSAGRAFTGVPQGPESQTSRSGGADPLQQLREQIRLEEELLGKTEAQQRVIRALGVDWESYGESTVNSLVASIEEMNRFNQQVEQQQRLADSIAGSFGDAFMSVVDGTKSTKDAFRSMAADIIKELYRVLVVQRMVGAISGALGPGGSAGGFLGRLLGGRESGGSMMAGRPYIVGERGPELVIPGRSSTVTNADLTNKAMGGSNGVTVVNNINVSGGTDPAAIRQEVAKLMPQITNATKSAVIDARRRGGQMKAAFS
jgi:flagellar hook-basal body complex protein FliE